MSEVLYEETQGITDLAIKLFMFAQERAITSGEEKLTASVIRSAAKDKFKLLQPALKAFKEKDKTALAHFEDAYPKFLKAVLLEKDHELDTVGEIAEEPEFKVLIDSNCSDISKLNVKENHIDTETEQAIADFFYTNNSKSNRQGMSKCKGKSSGLLPALLDSIENINETSGYFALKKAGLVCSGSEFLQGETE